MYEEKGNAFRAQTYTYLHIHIQMYTPHFINCCSFFEDKWGKKTFSKSQKMLTKQRTPFRYHRSKTSNNQPTLINFQVQFVLNTECQHFCNNMLCKNPFFNGKPKITQNTFLRNQVKMDFKVRNWFNYLQKIFII